MTYFRLNNILLEITVIVVMLFSTNAVAGACAVLDRRLGIVEVANVEPEPAKSQLEEFEYLKKEGASISEDEQGTVLIGFSMPASFEIGKAELNFNTKMNLNEIYKTLAPILEKYPNMTVEVSGHADSTGSVELNHKLSELRALNAKIYLIQHGIAKERITSIGHGKEYSMFTNETEIGRSVNRRIMIVARREAPPKTEKAEGSPEKPKETAKEITRNCIYIGVKAGYHIYTFHFGDDRDTYIRNGFGTGVGLTVLFPISKYFTIRPELSFYWRKLGSENWIDTTNGSASEFAVSVPLILQYLPTRNLYFEVGPELDIPILPKWTEKDPYINGTTTKKAYKDRAKIDVLVVLGIGYNITENFTADIKGALSLTRVDTYEKSPFDRYAQYGLNLTYFFK